MSEKPRVAIVGGGIGGAALALALQNRGFRVNVFERDLSFDARSQGYGLTMQQGANALAKLGLSDKISGVTSLAHFSFLPSGELIGAFGREFYAPREHPPLCNNGEEDDGRAGNAVSECVDSENTESSDSEDKCGGVGSSARRIRRKNIHLPRQSLRASLLAPLSEGTVVWGARLTGIEKLSLTDEEASSMWWPGTGVRLKFSDGREALADVAVGADGIFSAVRKLILPCDPCPLRYLGMMVILGRAPCTHPLVDLHVVQTLNGVTRIYFMPFTPGVRQTVMGKSVRFCVSFPRRLLFHYSTDPMSSLSRHCVPNSSQPVTPLNAHHVKIHNTHTHTRART